MNIYLKNIINIKQNNKNTYLSMDRLLHVRFIQLNAHHFNREIKCTKL